MNLPLVLKTLSAAFSVQDYKAASRMDVKPSVGMTVVAGHASVGSAPSRV